MCYMNYRNQNACDWLQFNSRKGSQWLLPDRTTNYELFVVFTPHHFQAGHCEDYTHCSSDRHGGKFQGNQWVGRVKVTDYVCSNCARSGRNGHRHRKWQPHLCWNLTQIIIPHKAGQVFCWNIALILRQLNKYSHLDNQHYGFNQILWHGLPGLLR